MDHTHQDDETQQAVMFCTPSDTEHKSIAKMIVLIVYKGH